MLRFCFFVLSLMTTLTLTLHAQSTINPEGSVDGVATSDPSPAPTTRTVEEDGTVIVDFNDLGSGTSVAEDRYELSGVLIKTSGGGSMFGSYGLGPCDGSRSLRTEPFTGPAFLFRFPSGATEVSLKSGDFGPSDADEISLTAYSDDALSEVVASATVSLAEGVETGCLDLSVSADMIKAVKVTSVGVYPNSVFVDHLAFKPFNYVALGDSYSAGEGAESYRIDLDGDSTTDPGENTDLETNRCHRSANAYPWVSYKMPEVRSRNFFACSGATTKNLRSNGSSQGYSAPDNVPQLQRNGIDETTKVVTLTIGGNDARFADILKWCYLHGECESYDPWGSVGELGTYVPQLIKNTVEPAVKATLSEIGQKAPNARIYLFGYPKIFPSNGSSCTALTDPPGFGKWQPDEQVWMNEMGDLLNAALRRAALANRATFIDVDRSELFKGHELCQAKSWFRTPDTLSNPEIFHPNAIGQRLGYRRAFEARLSSDGPVPKRSGSPRPPIVPKAPSSEPTIGLLAISTTAPLCATDVFSPGQQLDLEGDGFAAFAQVVLTLTTEGGSQQLGSATADGLGSFTTTLNLPSPLAPSPLALIEGRGTGSNGAARVVTASLAIGPPATTDSDNDGVPDACDLCPSASDPAQNDTDTDGLGDACDACPMDPLNDVDGDGLCAMLDPCPFDPDDDIDADGLCADVDNCPLDFNPGQEDADGDLFGDPCDSCPGGLDISCMFSNSFETGDTSGWTITR